MSVKGVDTVVGFLQQSPQRATTHMAQVMYRVGLEVFALSQQQVPVRKGTLRGSGHIDPPVTTGTDTVVTIGYGGAAAEYALWVHENTQAVHKPPQKAKYLEDPMRAALGSVEAKAAGIQGVLTGQAPAATNAMQVEAASGISRAIRGTSKARMAAGITNKHAMTPHEVHAALKKLRG